jgi:hypothetical protein
MLINSTVARAHSNVDTTLAQLRPRLLDRANHSQRAITITPPSVPPTSATKSGWLRPASRSADPPEPMRASDTREDDQDDDRGRGARVHEPDGRAHGLWRPRAAGAQAHPETTHDQICRGSDAGPLPAAAGTGHQHPEDLLSVLPPERTRIQCQQPPIRPFQLRLIRQFATRPATSSRFSATVA